MRPAATRWWFFADMPQTSGNSRKIHSATLLGGIGWTPNWRSTLGRWARWCVPLVVTWVAFVAPLVVKSVFMLIRRATLDDAEAICDLHIRSIRVLCAADYTQQQIEAWSGRKKPELYRQAMTEGGETIFVAVDGHHRIAGFVAFKAAEIYGLYVAPEFARRGAGSKLLATAEATMRAAGVTQVKFRSTFTALTFYTRHGYQRGDDAISRMSGVEMPCVWMSKSL